MGNMIQRAKSILRTNEFTALYDKGFHTGSELKTAQDLGIETIVAIPGVPSTSQAPNHDFNFEHFKYDQESDTYTCPKGEALYHYIFLFKFFYAKPVIAAGIRAALSYLLKCLISNSRNQMFRKEPV